CFSRGVPATMIALTGPARHDDAVPNGATKREPAPQPIVTASIGGRCPAAVRIAKPCPFCAATQVTASGTISSAIAAHDSTGPTMRGGASDTGAPLVGTIA